MLTCSHKAPIALPIHESGSPTEYTTGYAQPRDSTAPTNDANAPLQRTMKHLSHYRVHKKDIDTIPLCKRYKLSMI